MLSAVAAAVALVFAGPTDEPARYALTLSVVQAGVETVSARTVIVEDGNATVTVIDATGWFEMNAVLTPVQGDGQDELALQVSIADDDGQPQEPRLILRRGGEARLSIGQQGPDGRVTEGLEVTLSPMPAGE